MLMLWRIEDAIMCMCAHVSFYVRLKMVRLRLSPVCSTCLECLENSSTQYNLKLLRKLWQLTQWKKWDVKLENYFSLIESWGKGNKSIIINVTVNDDAKSLSMLIKFTENEHGGMGGKQYIFEPGCGRGLLWDL